MCLLCGDVSVGGHAIALVERPAHRLAGLEWQGSYRDAASGVLRDLIRKIKAFSDARASGWKSPIVGLSWNDRPGGFRYFAGIALDAAEEAPVGYEAIGLPEMRFASSWHGAEDGEVGSHYDRMIEWVRGEGLVWDVSRFHHREEYPHDVDLSRQSTLRLLVPVVDEADAIGTAE